MEKMQAACKTHGVPIPVLRHEATELWVEFENRVMGEDSGRTPEKILMLLDTDPSLTISELAQQIHKSTSAVERAIQKLREAGRLERIGPDKGGHRHVAGRDHE